MNGPPEKPVLFFDGECGLCSGVTRWLLERDREQRLLFAPLQGETAKALLPETLRDPQSVVLLHGDVIHTQSEAVLQTVSLLGKGWRILLAFRLVPRFLRDGLYRMVARHRANLTPRSSTCRLPVEDLGERLLP